LEGDVERCIKSVNLPTPIQCCEYNEIIMKYLIKISICILIVLLLQTGIYAETSTPTPFSLDRTYAPGIGGGVSYGCMILDYVGVRNLAVTSTNIQILCPTKYNSAIEACIDEFWNLEANRLTNPQKIECSNVQTITGNPEFGTTDYLKKQAYDNLKDSFNGYSNPSPTPPLDAVPTLGATNPGTSSDQTVPIGVPSWTPTPTQKPFNLDSFQKALNESTAGAIGGYCAVGGVVFEGAPPPDFAAEMNEGPSILKKIQESISRVMSSFTSKGMVPLKMAKDAMQPTKFCPISGLSYFYDETDTLIQSADIFETQKILFQDNDQSSRIIDELFTPDADIDSIIGALSNKERVVLAVDMLGSTKDMNIDQKGEVLEKIHTTLGTISCRCEDPSQLSANAQNSESNVAGASAQRGEVLSADEDYYEEKCRLEYPRDATGYAACTQSMEKIMQDCTEVYGESTPDKAERITNCVVSSFSYCKDHDDANILSCLDTQRKYLGSASLMCGALNDSMFNPDEYQSCMKCNYLEKGVWTAIGCVYSDFSKTIKEVIFPVAIGFAGLISLGCIIFASFTMQTSAGDPEKVKKAQELITSCIAGLIVVIFSVFILRVIGVDILRIPEFGG